MNNNLNFMNRELTNEEKEAFKNLRISGLRKLGSCSFILMIASLISIGIGIGSIGAFAKEGKLPHDVGAALISGCLTLLAATFGILAYKEGMAQERASSDYEIDPPFSVKCKIICHYVFNVLNFTILGFSGTAGIIGIVQCNDDDAECERDHDAKLALSVLTLVIAAVLMLITLPLTIWFCYYARAFNFQNRYNSNMQFQVMRMQHQLEKQQRQLNNQQKLLEQQNRGGYYNTTFN